MWLVSNVRVSCAAIADFFAVIVVEYLATIGRCASVYSHFAQSTSLDLLFCFVLFCFTLLISDSTIHCLTASIGRHPVLGKFDSNFASKHPPVYLVVLESEMFAEEEVSSGTYHSHLNSHTYCPVLDQRLAMHTTWAV